MVTGNAAVTPAPFSTVRDNFPLLLPRELGENQTEDCIMGLFACGLYFIHSTLGSTCW
jgi:hypothetical protein